MESIQQVHELLLRILDYPLGWLLLLPRDLTLVAIATGTALSLALVRKWLTDQDLLGRVRADVSRLQELLKAARGAQDKSAVQRIRGTLGLVRAIPLKADMKVVAIVILPLGLLAMWAAERVDYLPLRVGEEVTLSASYPLSSAERLTHLVPDEAFELRSPAIQSVQLDPNDGSRASAAWRLVPRQAFNELELNIRHQGTTVIHRLRAGGTTYLPPIQRHANERILATELGLRRYSLLGLGPASEVVGLAPWLIAYLALAILLVPLFRRVLRVS